MGDAGRPTDLTQELFNKIKGWVLEGKNIREMAELSEHPVQTLYQWASTNYLGFQDKLDGWKRDRILSLAERNIADYLDMDTTNVTFQNGKLMEGKDTSLERIKADMSKFAAETLGKNVGYAKRTELGQKNGTDLPVPIMGNYVPVHGGNPEGVGAVVPHPGGAGGNVGVQDGVDSHPADPPGADGQDPDLD